MLCDDFIRLGQVEWYLFNHFSVFNILFDVILENQRKADAVPMGFGQPAILIGQFEPHAANFGLPD